MTPYLFSAASTGIQGGAPKSVLPSSNSRLHPRWLGAKHLWSSHIRDSTPPCDPQWSAGAATTSLSIPGPIFRMPQPFEACLSSASSFRPGFDHFVAWIPRRTRRPLCRFLSRHPTPVTSEELELSLRIGFDVRCASHCSTWNIPLTPRFPPVAWHLDERSSTGLVLYHFVVDQGSNVALFKTPFWRRQSTFPTSVPRYLSLSAALPFVHRPERVLPHLATSFLSRTQAQSCSVWTRRTDGDTPSSPFATSEEQWTLRT